MSYADASLFCNTKEQCYVYATEITIVRYRFYSLTPGQQLFIIMEATCCFVAVWQKSHLTSLLDKL